MAGATSGGAGPAAGSGGNTSPGGRGGGGRDGGKAGATASGGSATGGSASGGSATGGATAGTGGSGGSATGGKAGTAGAASTGKGCTPAPTGMFTTTRIEGTGPDGNYVIVRPSTLGEGGFKHPPIAWGNGLNTSPNQYRWLEDIAEHGFVIICNPGTGSNAQVVRQGLEWLIAQGEAASGDYAGKLANNCAGTLGYSMGGGAAVGSASHPAVRATVSIHGLSDAAEKASGPILLTTSEDDTFVTKEQFVEPCYERSSVQPTILASHTSGGHQHPIGNIGEDLPPTIAWFRYWLYGDDSQRTFFFGDDCTLCSWDDFRRKNHTWD
jgi:hypothetical protein